MTTCPISHRSATHSSPDVQKPQRWAWAGPMLLAIAVPALLLLCLWGLQQQWELDLFTAAGFRMAAEQLGVWGPLLYVLLLIVSVVVSQIPGAGLAIAAGAIWGPLAAGIYSVVGGFLGALIAYGLGQTFGPGLLKALTGKRITFSPERGQWYLGGLIFLMRLVPVFSFDLISYGAGIAKLSLPIYAGATLLGMVPSTFLLTYAGGAFQWGPEAVWAIVLLLALVLVLLPWSLRRCGWLKLDDILEID